ARSYAAGTSPAWGANTFVSAGSSGRERPGSVAPRSVVVSSAAPEQLSARAAAAPKNATRLLRGFMCISFASVVRKLRGSSPIMFVRACSMLTVLFAATCVGPNHASRASVGPRAPLWATSADAGLSTSSCAGDASGSPDPRTCSAARDRIWGVTVADPYALDATVDALRSLPARPTARIVFDEGVPAATYADVVPAIHAVADVMGEILDSQFVADIGVDAYRARTREYVAALGPSVDIWEVGNEINGEWLG